MTATNEPKLGRESIASGRISCNATVVWDESTGRAVLFDPTDDPEPILEAIRSRKLSVGKILLTHAHLDHASRAEHAARILGATIHLHPDDFDLYRRGPASGAAYGIEVPAPTMAPTPISHLEEFDFGFKVQARHVPGHTRGGVAFHIPDLGTVVAGDTLFFGSIGRTDLPDSVPELMESSIRRELYSLPPETVVVTGHGPDTTIGRERRMNPYVKG